MQVIVFITNLHEIKKKIGKSSQKVKNIQVGYILMLILKIHGKYKYVQELKKWGSEDFQQNGCYITGSCRTVLFFSKQQQICCNGNWYVGDCVGSVRNVH